MLYFKKYNIMCTEKKFYYKKNFFNFIKSLLVCVQLCNVTNTITQMVEKHSKINR